MEGNTITVSVKPEIYSYIVQGIGTDTVPLRKGRTLTRVIVPHLTLASPDTEEPPVPDGFMPLKFELPQWIRTCESASGRVYCCYPLFRCMISPEGEAAVRRFLANSFKQSFRFFMDGYIIRQQEESKSDSRIVVKGGVVQFLMAYHIDVRESLVTSLTRDWYRHNDDNEKNLVSPLIY